MTNEDLLKLSAYADDELTAPERVELEAKLERAPAFTQTLAAFKKLHTAARNETIPSLSSDASETLWPLIAERSLSVPALDAERLNQFAASESVPVISNDRFTATWKDIKLSTSARREAAPRVQPEKWDRAWNTISARSTAVKKIDSTERIRPAKATSPFSYAWKFAAGIGLAASLYMMFGIPGLTPQPTLNPEPVQPIVAVSSMSIPETQDDNYGVRVRFVPGSSDPVVTLYYKSADRVNGLMSGDLDTDQ
ncbi:MAG: hypothetical protein WCT04_06965 [Planctomycetota bacterium]